MTNKFIDLTLFATLSFLCYVLNLCTKIWQCSLVFICLCILVQGIAYFFSVKKAAYQISSAVIGNFIALYAFANTNFSSALTAVSLLSCLASIYAMLSISYNKLDIRKAMPTSLLSSLFVAVFIDCAMFSIFFIANKTYGLQKIFYIFSKDIAFKGMYLMLAFVISYSLLKVSNKACNNNT